MTKRFALSVLLLAMILPGITHATTKKKQKTHLTLLEAYNRQMPESEPRTQPTTGDHFVIKWNDVNYPETFFWRGANGWLPCKIEKAHRPGKAGNYITTAESGRTPIHQGDTLMLSPMTGGKFPIPKEIPENAKNTLFYKTGGSAWLSLPIKKIVKK